MNQDDPAWTPGKQNPPAPKTSQRKRQGREKIPSPTPEELQNMSAAEKTKVARRMRNRKGAQKSKDQKSLELQITQLKRENTPLQAQLATQTAEMNQITSELGKYKAQHQDISPFSSSSYFLASPDAPLLHPDDPMNPNNNNNNSGNNNSHIANPSTPTTEAAGQGLALPVPPPGTATAATAPATGTPAVAEPDLNSVMQWKYPGAYYDSAGNMIHYYHPQTGYYHHFPHGGELEDPPLVFTPFAAVTSPREGLLLSPTAGVRGGSGGGGGVNYGSGNMRSTEFSAWRPREHSGPSQLNQFNNNNFSSNEPSVPWWATPTVAGSVEYQYPWENSNTARELARMMSSPAAFSGPVPD